MAELDYKRSVDELKVKWTLTSMTGDYIFLTPLVFFDGLAIFFLYKDPTVGTLVFIVLLSGVLAAGIWAVKTADKLTALPMGRNALTYRPQILDYLNDNDWKVRWTNQQYVVAYKSRWFFIGKRLVIIFKGKMMLVNVRNAETILSLPFSLGGNYWQLKQISLKIKSFDD